jgi:hypothetical protein
MPQPPLPVSIYEETARLFYDCDKNVARAARAAGVPYNTFSSRVRKARELELISDSAHVNASNSKEKPDTTVVVKPVYRIQQRNSKPEETKKVLAIGDCHDGPTMPDKTRFYAMGRYARTTG